MKNIIKAIFREIAATSASIDLHAKFRVYQRSGVAEYFVWQALEGRIEWFSLEEDEYKPMVPDATGLLSSRVFPGLCCRGAEFLRLDATAVLRTLAEHIESPAHADFVRSLSSIRGGASLGSTSP